MDAVKIAILGSVGVPANYGGFETLAENLVRYHSAEITKVSLTIYCSGKSYRIKNSTYLSADLKYIPLNANGIHSVFYDVWSLFSAIWNRHGAILLLGVSGAIALPLIRRLSSVQIVTNIDGIEWRREKWRGLARHFLHFSERMAVRHSHAVIADNVAISEYIKRSYGADSHVIAYGGDHAALVTSKAIDEYDLPETYALSVCRIEPENNVHMVLAAFSEASSNALVLIGNWSNSEYGRSLREQYMSYTNLYLFDPIYDLGKLKTFRNRSSMYIHGHSAGGTNPSLVEAMHFGKPVFAFDCDFNRETTEGKAIFFKTSDELIRLVEGISRTEADAVGCSMLEIANRLYTWRAVGCSYFSVLTDKVSQ